MARKTTLERLLSEIINASASASGTWMQADTKMMSKLLNKDWKKIGSFQTRMKLSRPTHLEGAP